MMWILPGYTELQQLGAGATGRVVLARHDESGTVVAVKYLSPPLCADQEFRARFRVEAQLLAAVDDPNLARLYHYLEAPNGAAIVMEPVHGVSLQQLIARCGPTEPAAALTVLKGSLLGLAAAHAQGVVHQDYKPANVLVRPDGLSKLVDFGVAVRSGEAHRPTGTPFYMAPEQWRGEPVTPATDVYAATATFVECLTGRPPFPVTDVQQLALQHLNAPVPTDGMPPPVQQLVHRGMAKNLAGRPASALQFIAELDHVATLALGQDWERRGFQQLAGRVMVLPDALNTDQLQLVANSSPLADPRPNVGGPSHSGGVPPGYVGPGVPGFGYVAPGIPGPGYGGPGPRTAAGGAGARPPGSERFSARRRLTVWTGAAALILLLLLDGPKVSPALPEPDVLAIGRTADVSVGAVAVTPRTYNGVCTQGEAILSSSMTISGKPGTEVSYRWVRTEDRTSIESPPQSLLIPVEGERTVQISMRATDGVGSVAVVLDDPDGATADPTEYAVDCAESATAPVSASGGSAAGSGSAAAVNGSDGGVAGSGGSAPDVSGAAGPPGSAGAPNSGPGQRAAAGTGPGPTSATGPGPADTQPQPQEQPQRQPQPQPHVMPDPAPGGNVPIVPDPDVGPPPAPMVAPGGPPANQSTGTSGYSQTQPGGVPAQPLANQSTGTSGYSQTQPGGVPAQPRGGSSGATSVSSGSTGTAGSSTSGNDDTQEYGGSSGSSDTGGGADEPDDTQDYGGSTKDGGGPDPDVK